MKIHLVFEILLDDKIATKIRGIKMVRQTFVARLFRVFIIIIIIYYNYIIVS